MGNEVYGWWDSDPQEPAHDPPTYAFTRSAHGRRERRDYPKSGRRSDCYQPNTNNLTASSTARRSRDSACEPPGALGPAADENGFVAIDRTTQPPECRADREVHYPRRLMHRSH
jgi:hypothetical protein